MNNIMRDAIARTKELLGLEHTPAKVYKDDKFLLIMRNDNEKPKTWKERLQDEKKAQGWKRVN